ncbi:MAG: carboxypeptidase regulatory-like domain-containing protein, partial [Gemmatimonadales bacterium]
MMDIPVRGVVSSVAVVAWVAALSVHPAQGQEVYGGLRGRVANPTGTGAAGARVSLVGTAFTALADSQGRYTIDFVPAGVYTVRAQLGEAAPWERPLVWVIAGEAIELDLELGAGRGSAVPDSFLPRALPGLTSRTVIPGRLLDSLPVDDVRQALTLSPGAVLRGNDLGIASREDLSIRGGGLGEAAVYIDGAPVRFKTFGVRGVALWTAGLAEVSVTTGVPGPAVADARGGVIAYVSRSGGPTMQGWVRAETDEPFAEGSSVGFNRFTGAVGGPFSPVRNLTWQVSATLLGQRSHYYGKGAADQPSYALGGIDTVVELPGGAFFAPGVLPRFVQASGQCGQTGNANTGLGREVRDNYGFACTGLRRPMDWSTDWRAQAKLAYSYGAGSSLGLTLLASEHQERFFPGAALANPALYQGARAWSRLAVANWGQRLGRFRGGPLHLHVNLSVGTDRQIAGALDAASEAATRAPALGVQLGALQFTGLDVFPFPITDWIVRNVRTRFGLRTPYFGRSDLGTSYEGRLNPYGMATGWPTHGVGASFLTLVDEQRLSARSAVSWRPGRVHRVTLGGDDDRTDLSFYNANLITESGLDAFRAKPRRWGLFAADRVELGKLVIDAGVRYDRYTPGTEFPRTPGRISSVDAATAPPNGRQWNPAGATDDTAYANSVARAFDEGQGQGTLSPRLRVLYNA